MFGVLSPASADTMNYKIRYDGDSMVIVPYYSMPAAPEIQRTIPTIETAPVKILLPSIHICRCSHDG